MIMNMDTSMQAKVKIRSKRIIKKGWCLWYDRLVDRIDFVLKEFQLHQCLGSDECAIESSSVES